MIKTLLSAGSVAANTNVPLSLMVNTNNKTELNDNTIVLKDVGAWDVKANAVLSATTTGDLVCQLLANGTPVLGAESTHTVASGDEYTFHINDVVRTIASTLGNVNLSLQFDQAVTILGGDMIVEYVR